MNEKKELNQVEYSKFGKNYEKIQDEFQEKKI
jgi:hypothetical protein